MEAAYENDHVIHRTVEKAVGKSTDESAPHVTVEKWVSFRKTHDRSYSAAGLDQKFGTETTALFLVLPVNCFDIRSGSRTEYVWLHRARARICATTSSQGMPTGPSNSRSFSRRSSSPLCAADSGSARGSRPTLSHRRSRSSSRSSSLSRLTSTAGFPTKKPWHDPVVNARGRPPRIGCRDLGSLMASDLDRETRHYRTAAGSAYASPPRSPKSSSKPEGPHEFALIPGQSNETGNSATERRARQQRAVEHGL